MMDGVIFIQENEGFSYRFLKHGYAYFLNRTECLQMSLFSIFLTNFFHNSSFDKLYSEITSNFKSGAVPTFSRKPKQLNEMKKRIFLAQNWICCIIS